MLHGSKWICVVVGFTTLVTGCRTLAPETAFLDVADRVESRIGKRISWDLGTKDDMAVRTSVKRLLSRRLAPASAIQIALLNNRELQAAYADLGIAQAALVQAGLLKNPVFDGAVTWFNDAGGTPNLAFGLAWNFIDLLHMPLREAVAESELEEAKIKVAGRVIKHAADTHAAFVDFVAANQEIGLFAQVVRSARASLSAAKALREAGNITALQFDQSQSFLTQAKLELSQAETRKAEAREKLNVLMGLTGPDTEWKGPAKLLDVPGRELSTRAIERRALQKSLDIALGRQRLITLGRRFRLVKKKSLLPDVEVGGEFEREVEVEEGEKNLREALGPTFELEIPIFDHGQAKKAGAYMQIRKAEDELWALAVRLRSAARLARARLLMARKTARYYRKSVLPQSQKILAGTQRDYNAMQQSVFQLVSAKRQQILAGRQYIQALRAYWTARIRFQQLMNGQLPEGGGGAMEIASAPAGGEDTGGH